MSQGVQRGSIPTGTFGQPQAEADFEVMGILDLIGIEPQEFRLPARIAQLFTGDASEGLVGLNDMNPHPRARGWDLFIEPIRIGRREERFQRRAGGDDARKGHLNFLTATVGSPLGPAGGGSLCEVVPIRRDRR